MHILHWYPVEVFASAHGDFGVSWGNWENYPDGNLDINPSRRGRYINVWRRNGDGEWRVLMDFGARDRNYDPEAEETDN